MKKFLSVLTSVLFAQASWAQSEKQLNAWAKEAALNSFPMLREVLSIPNDGSRMPEIELNVKWCEHTFKERRFDIQRIETPKAPLLLAEKKFPDAKQTVLVYLQIDGQPVDPSRWFQENPYIPVLKLSLIHI